MAKHTRRTAKFVAIPDLAQITLGALANSTVVLDTAITMAEALNYKSCDVVISISGLTPTEGPITIGLADPGLTVTEIGEAVDAAPVSSTDYPAVEHAKRPVRKICTFAGQLANETFNDGRKKRVRLRLSVADGTSLPRFWAQNRSGATLTTGAIVKIDAVHYGNWK